MAPLMAGQMPVVVVSGGEFAVALRDRLLPGRDDPCYFRRLCLYLCFCVLVFVAKRGGCPLGSGSMTTLVRFVEPLLLPRR